MDFQDIYSEVYNRGFHYLNDGSTETARVKQWVNDAYAELCDEADWPFLETTATGNAPLALTRAKKVLSVVNTTDGQELNWAPREWVMDIYGTPPAGTPRYWYVEYSATDTMTVNVAPTAADSLSVRAIQHPTALSGDSDTPVVPARYHWLIVEGAVRRAYVDSDQYEQAAAVEAFRAQGLNTMRMALLSQAQPSPNRADLTKQPMQNQAGALQERGGDA